MKNLLKIGALSLALIAVVFMLNKTEANDTGIVKVQITGTTGYCVYGKDRTGGSIAYSTSTTGYLSGAFLTTGSAAKWYCVDSEGDLTWTLDISSADLKAGNGDATHTIANTNVYASGNTVQQQSGTCSTLDAGDIQAGWAALSANRTVLGKIGSGSDTCTIFTNNVALKVDVPPLKAIGTYTGVLTVTINSTFADGNAGN